MKWMLGLLISVFILNQERLSANTYSISNNIFSCGFNYSIGANQKSEVFFNIPPEFKHFTSNSSSDNQHPLKRKKKNRKGVKPVYYCLPIDCVFFSLVSINDGIFSKKDFVTSCSFSGNGKRGPPYLFV
jgi:hypothetical protein